ncbi:S-adenosyl-L-methionine-dependent methyltransferase, partial [Mycena rosella]
RLDGVHFAIREYLDDKICLAPIYGTSPTRILELGSVLLLYRAIDAAADFPKAQVFAVDLTSIPASPLPKNLNFQVFDVTQGFPFEEKSFDVVHARFILMHLPNGKDVLERAAKLVKPGGWLVVEDYDMRSMIESSGPAVSHVITTWIGILQARGADGEIGRKLESIIHNSGEFSQISTHKIPIPICNTGSVPKNLTKLGSALKMSVKKLADDWAQRFSAQGITQDDAEKYKKEIDTNVRKLS